MTVAVAGFQKRFPTTEARDAWLQQHLPEAVTMQIGSLRRGYLPGDRMRILTIETRAIRLIGALR